MALDDDNLVWACALALEKQYGDRASLHAAERIETLALTGDEAGVAAWQAIAVRLAQLRQDDIVDRRRPN